MGLVSCGRMSSGVTTAPITLPGNFPHWIVVIKLSNSCTIQFVCTLHHSMLYFLYIYQQTPRLSAHRCRSSPHFASWKTLCWSAPENFPGPGTLFHYFVLTLGCFYVGVFPSQFFFTKVFSQLFFFKLLSQLSRKSLAWTWNLRHIRGRHGPNNWATWEALSTIWLLPFSYIFADISRRMWKSKFWSVNFLI